MSSTVSCVYVCVCVRARACPTDLHVLDRVDGDTGHADIACYSRVVTVVPTMCCEVKGNAEPLLPSRKVLTVKLVAFLHRAETSVLQLQHKREDVSQMNT
jgi:hypothetical protein